MADADGTVRPSAGRDGTADRAATATAPGRPFISSTAQDLGEGGRQPPFGLVRSPDRIVAGVAGGLAVRLGVDAVLVRLAAVVLAFAGGAGIVAYLVLWAAADPAPDAPAARPAAGPEERALRRAAALGLIVLGTLLVLRDAGVWFGDALVWPVALAAFGSAVIWSRSDEQERARWAQLAARMPGDPVGAVLDDRAARVRLIAGALLVCGGMATVLITNVDVTAAWNALLAVLVTVAGTALILGPWIARLVRQLGDERRERIRSEERAEMAAHLHDSVLQTLALIQRAGAPEKMASLARGQERELRAWLYGRNTGEPGDHLAAAVEAAAARVEQAHLVPVEVVVVGDAVLDEGLRALVDALGEAMTNAARHAGAAAISVYVEVESDAVTAFVHDEGKGFDPASVPADRRGIAESIRGRMTRHRGSATIASAPGEGTEVQLRIHRSRDMRGETP